MFHKIHNWLLWVKVLIFGLPPEYIVEQKKREKKAIALVRHLNKLNNSSSSVFVDSRGVEHH